MIFTFLAMSLLCPYFVHTCPYFCKYVYRLLETVGRVLKVHCGLYQIPNCISQQSLTANNKVMRTVFKFLPICPYFVHTLSILVHTLSILVHTLSILSRFLKIRLSTVGDCWTSFKSTLRVVSDPKPYLPTVSNN